MVENVVILFLHANWPSMTRFNAKVLLNCAEGFAIEAKRTNQRKIKFGQTSFPGFSPVRPYGARETGSIEPWEPG